jgi:hypothetical protein
VDKLGVSFTLDAHPWSSPALGDNVGVSSFSLFLLLFEVFMKIAGRDPKTLPPEEVLVLPRMDDVIVFRARGISDMTEFEKLCPEPAAPTIFAADGQTSVDMRNKDYLAALEEHSKRRWAYIVIKSLELGESHIEWDTVKLEQPSSWTNWERDLLDGGFTKVECNRVFHTVLAANSLDEVKIQRARELFLLGRQTA